MHIQCSVLKICIQGHRVLSKLVVQLHNTLHKGWLKANIKYLSRIIIFLTQEIINNSWLALEATWHQSIFLVQVQISSQTRSHWSFGLNLKSSNKCLANINPQAAQIMLKTSFTFFSKRKNISNNLYLTSISMVFLRNHLYHRNNKILSRTLRTRSEIMRAAYKLVSQ